jgi:hypothetical protein
MSMEQVEDVALLSHLRLDVFLVYLIVGIAVFESGHFALRHAPLQLGKQALIAAPHALDAVAVVELTLRLQAACAAVQAAVLRPATLLFQHEGQSSLLLNEACNLALKTSQSFVLTHSPFRAPLLCQQSTNSSPEHAPHT